MELDSNAVVASPRASRFNPDVRFMGAVPFVCWRADLGPEQADAALAATDPNIREGSATARCSAPAHQQTIPIHRPFEHRRKGLSIWSGPAIIPCVTTTPAAPAAPSKPALQRGKTVAILVVLVVVLAYIVTLFGYWWLSGSAKELDASGEGNGSETTVLITLQSLRTVDYKADAKVLVIPADSLVDDKLDTLKEDIAVRLHPWNSLGDLKFPAGAAPAEVTTTIDVDGDVNTWPFDRYETAGHQRRPAGRRG